MIEATAPEGFKTTAYLNVETEKNETLYVCQKCRPQWDTFDEAVAKAHASAKVHNPELLRAG